jgi:hypothetical protein
MPETSLSTTFWTLLQQATSIRCHLSSKIPDFKRNYVWGLEALLGAAGKKLSRQREYTISLSRCQNAATETCVSTGLSGRPFKRLEWLRWRRGLLEATILLRSLKCCSIVPSLKRFIMMISLDSYWKCQSISEGLFAGTCKPWKHSWQAISQG